MEKLCLSTFGFQSAAERSVAFQYTSVILIILTFIIGSYAHMELTDIRTATPEGGQREKAQMFAAKEAPILPLLNDKPIGLSFTAYGEVDPSDELMALIEVLRHHDLDITFTITTSPEKLDGEISKFLAVQQYMMSEGVPLSSIRAIFPLSKEKKSSVTYSLSKE